MVNLIKEGLGRDLDPPQTNPARGPLLAGPWIIYTYVQYEFESGFRRELVTCKKLNRPRMLAIHIQCTGMAGMVHDHVHVMG